MKKLVICLIGMSLLIVTFACDGPNNDIGCGDMEIPNWPRENGGIIVPTCGEAVIDANGITHESTELFVNWKGPGPQWRQAMFQGLAKMGNPGR